MNYNDFRLGGRYKHKYKVYDNHLIILMESFANKDNNKNEFIEIDIYDNELISLVEQVEDNELIAIIGHIESETCTINDNFNYMNKILVADKLMRKGN